MTNEAAVEATGQWTEIEPGLSYLDLRKSDGEPIATGDIVQVHYQVALGDLRDGQPPWIDSSWEKPKPFQFRIGAGEVLKGIDVGVAGMRVAGERRMVLAPEWAYGERGLAELVPGGSTLTIQVYIVMKEEPERTGGAEG